MFVDFLFHLRAHGIKVSTTEWLSLMHALVHGYSRANLTVFYDVARACVVKSEANYDRYDQAFASFFNGVSADLDLTEELLDWLGDPVLPRELTPEELAMLEAWDLDRLREELEERLRQQNERHDRGNRWVGTGGTSPFGHGGKNPAGIRIGGPGGGRSAVQVAELRRFRNLRNDRVLDTRSIGMALRRLRRLARESGPEELDLEKTIDKTAREGGEIDLVFAPPRANRIKLLLLMDVGGSMDPHTELCERLFSAAHAASHFKAFRTLFFHNCPYDRLYEDMHQWKGPKTEDVFREVDSTWSLVFVGDAWMAPYELTHQGGAIYFGHQNRRTGLEWLLEFRQKVPNSLWLNPEPRRLWHADTIAMVHSVFPMFELTLDGLSAAVDVLRGAKPNRP
ncbi:MAG: VWA domain-containing protein, partial [Myxococcota bacterium]